MNIDFGELVRDCGENRFGVALFKFGEDNQRFHIRPQVEKILRRNLAGHDRPMNFVFPKKLQQSAQLSDAQPLNNIDMLRNRGIGFVSERGSDDFLYSCFARSGTENSWINAVARNDSENLRRLQIVELTNDDGA